MVVRSTKCHFVSEQQLININYKKLILFLSRVSILLLTRDIDIVILSVRLSVCLSVTRWYYMKTA